MFSKTKELIFKPFIDLIYPPVCYLCNNVIDDPKICICSECWSQFKKFDKCSQQYFTLMECFKGEKLIENFISSYIFEKESKFQEVVHLLKYRNVKSLGIRLGEDLGRIVQKEFNNIDIITSIPLHRLKKRERGYNQVDFICRGISNILKIIYIDDLILRIRYTLSQTKLNIIERRENVKDAFSVNQKYKNQIKDKVILIVDDVITTGATINSAARALRDTGCGIVYAASAGVAAELE